MVFVFLFVVTGVFAQHHPSPPQNYIQTFEGELKKEGLRDFELFIDHFSKKHGLGFTFVPNSKSNQEGERALVFSENGRFVVGKLKGHPDLEILLNNLETGERSFHEGERGKDGTLSLSSANNSRCMECHTKKLVYILGEYAFWQGFLGENDDIVPHDDPTYQKLTQAPEWKSLFRLPNPFNLRSFPYHETEDRTLLPPKSDRRLMSMPNVRLTELAIRMTARKLLFDLKRDFPERYHRYKYALAHELLDCDRKKIPSYAKQIAAEYKERVPQRDQIWQRYFENPKRKNPFVIEMKLLQLLGTNPHEIILKKPIQNSSNGPEELTLQFSGLPPYRGFLGIFSPDAILQNFLREFIPEITGKNTYIVQEKNFYLKQKGGKETLRIFEGYPQDLIFYPSSIAHKEELCKDLIEKANEALKLPFPPHQAAGRNSAPVTSHYR